MSRRAEQVTAFVLTAMVVVLHVLRLQHAGPLWRDEVGAARVAALPTLHEVYTSFTHEAFPLLFPGTLRAYTGLFGDSDLAFRIFGLAVGLAILAALWWNARIAGALPLVSLVLIQLHPAFPLYGDSIRGYGLGTLAILLTLGAFARLVERPDRKSVLLALLAAVASVHLLLHNAALLAGIGGAAAVVGLLRRRFRVTAAALGVGCAAALTLLPYVSPLSAAQDWNILLTEKITLWKVLLKLRTVICTPFPWLVWVWGGAVVLAAVRTLTPWPPLPPALTPTRERGNHLPTDDARLFRLLVIPAALGGEIAFLIFLGYGVRIWYLLPVLALVASALDGLLAAGGTAPVRLARIAAAALLTAALYATAFDTAKVRMTNVDLVAQAIAEKAGPRDLVLVNEWYCGISFDRYYRGDTRWMTVPRLDDHRMHRFDLIKAKMRTGDPLLEVRRAMRRTLRAGRRVWVVGHFKTPPEGSPATQLPPAPRSQWGWREVPYTVAWTEQIGEFLESNALHKRRVRVPPASGRVSQMEFFRIWMYGGWKGKLDHSSPPARME